MIVTYQSCNRKFNDEDRWTYCPHSVFGPATRAVAPRRASAPFWRRYLAVLIPVALVIPSAASMLYAAFGAPIPVAPVAVASPAAEHTAERHRKDRAAFAAYKQCRMENISTEAIFECIRRKTM